MAPDATPELPRRKHDALSVRALAHPSRLAILQVLRLHPSANVRMIADEIGEPANGVSFHLRQLEKYGYVCRATPPATATKRESWWELVAERGRISLEDLSDAGSRAALSGMLHGMFSQRATAMIEAIEATGRAVAKGHGDDLEYTLGNFSDVVRLTDAQATKLSMDLAKVLEDVRAMEPPDDEPTYVYQLDVEIIPRVGSRRPQR